MQCTRLEARALKQEMRAVNRTLMLGGKVTPQGMARGKNSDLAAPDPTHP